MKAYNVLVRRAAPGSSRCFTLEQFLPIGDVVRKVSARLSWRGESSLTRDWLIAFLYLRKSHPKNTHIDPTHQSYTKFTYNLYYNL